MGEIDLGDVAVFARVVDAGGFSAAATALRAPKSSVSRRVARLESALGTRLLHRTTRSVTLTEAGRAYYARVSNALAEMSEAAAAALDAREEPRGTIRMTAPPDVGAEILPGLIAGFVARHPHVRVEVDFVAETPSLVHGGYDLGLHGGRPDPSLAATKLQDTAFRLYAAETYLARAGVPHRAEDLAGHACVLFRVKDGTTRLNLRHRDGDINVEVSGPIAANDLSFVRRAAIAGAGIALIPALVGARSVANGRLVAVLPDYHATGIPLNLVYPSTRHVPLHVRALRDHLLTHFPQ
ncbi:LysR family transcriptional regulator [Actinokineospora sp. NBRC 105648]|uniref:LysR family transcriptional regulator n=1 Tax=Actinokineospora sp. NBRC 105648 TaxID=3032206 RepID=UPI00249FD97E|nr:LysR family transcriptional regulator [Actinokineospora sp. NBRC 105648]GLZ37129.1 transcriptional regulator [Actinokineospora sp. NBRC 105648]